VTFDPEALVECGLTGNEPLPFRPPSFDEAWAIKHSGR